MTLKDNETRHVINWKVVEKSIPYVNESDNFRLCLIDRALFTPCSVLRSLTFLLNSRSEMFSGCMYKYKWRTGKSHLFQTDLISFLPYHLRPKENSTFYLLTFNFVFRFSFSIIYCLHFLYAVLSAWSCFFCLFNFLASLRYVVCV